MVARVGRFVVPGIGVVVGILGSWIRSYGYASWRVDA